MDPAPTALVALAILGFVPGALLYRALRPNGSRLEGAALAPTLSFAFVFLFGEAGSVTGIPFAPLPFLVAVGAVGVAAVLRSRSRRTPDGRPASEPAHRPATLLLVAGIVLGAGSWLLGIQGLGATPPHSDSVNHGLMAAQVSDRESLDPGKVLSSDVTATASATQETAYYPLALHGVVALAHRLFGIGYADGLLAVTFLFSSVVLPLGLFAAVRRLVPDNPLLAGVTALLGGTTGFFPLLPLSFGGLPLVIGTAMVPAVATVIAGYLVGGGSVAQAALGAVGAVGILATHTSEIPLLALFLAPFAVAAVLSRRRAFPAVARRTAILGLIALLLTAPTLSQIAGGTSERSGIDEGRVASLGQAFTILRSVVGGGGADVVALIAVAGVGLCLYRRRHTPLVATTAGMLGLFVVAAGVHGPLRALTVPWYQHPGRLALNLVLVIPFFAAFAITELLPALWARRAMASNPLTPVLALAGVLAFAGSAGGGADLRVLFRERVLIGSDAESAFAFLKANVAPGERVLNDGNTDGGMWMYPFDGVVPLMGLQPANPGPSWEERAWLVGHLADLGQDPKVRAELDRYDVRFVYWDERSFEGNPHRLDIPTLEDHPLLCERFKRGSVRVMEVAAQPGCV